MQEEVNEKTVSLCITGGKGTVRLLKQAMMRFLAAMEKEKAEKARKQQTMEEPNLIRHVHFAAQRVLKYRQCQRK